MQPASVTVNNNRGNAFLARADAVVAEGGDPSNDVAEAIASAEKAIALRPDYAFSQFNIAYGSMLVARHRAGRGDDPAAPLAKTHEWLARYNSLPPDDPDAAMCATVP